MDVPQLLWSMFSTKGDKAVLKQDYVRKVLNLLKNRVPQFADSRAVNGRMGTAFKRPGSQDEISFYIQQGRILVITVENFGDDEPEMEINDQISQTVIQILEEVNQSIEIPPAAAQGARRRMRRKSLRRTRRNK